MLWSDRAKTFARNATRKLGFMSAVIQTEHI